MEDQSCGERQQFTLPLQLTSSLIREQQLGVVSGNIRKIKCVLERSTFGVVITPPFIAKERPVSAHCGYYLLSFVSRCRTHR